MKYKLLPPVGDCPGDREGKQEWMRKRQRIKFLHVKREIAIRLGFGKKNATSDNRRFKESRD
jgi:hypothetical protein